jgi:manganese/zinc/iron transport system substrate-binding protein
MERPSKLRQLALTLAAVMIVGGCRGSAKDQDASTAGDAFSGDYPISAMATVGMVGDIVRHVGGEHIEVGQMMGAGVDPHRYVATSDDVRAILKADIVFYSGLMLEGKLADTLVKVARTKPVVAITELIDQTNLLEPEGMDGHFDPHVWMDVEAWSECVLAVENALVEFDPAHTDEYRANAKDYRDELSKLHAYGLEVIKTIPEGRRVLITSHDAFNYFGRAYGLDVQGVQGISTESEAGLQRTNELVDLIVAQNVAAVFVESSVPRKSIEALVQGARSKGLEIKVGGELFSDAMGADRTYEGTYVGMLDHNITLVTRALGGQAPAKGLNGKLSTTEVGD